MLASDLMERMKAAFRNEAVDLLDELDSSLLELEGNPHDSEIINRIFRAIHTVKGSGATAGFIQLARFAHQVEELFDLAREGKLTVTPDMLDDALKAVDFLRCCLDDVDADISGREQQLGAAIRHHMPEGTAVDLHPAAQHQTVQKGGGPSTFHISVQVDPSIFATGADPASLLLDLADLGEIRVRVHTEDLPSFDDFDPERCYLWWEIELTTEESEERIREVFLYVGEDCTAEVTRVASASDLLALGAAVSGDDQWAAFENAKEQCTETLDFCLSESGEEWMDGGSADTCLRSLNTLSAASKYQSHAALQQSLASQIASLAASLEQAGQLSRTRLRDSWAGIANELAQVEKSRRDRTKPAKPTTTERSAPAKPNAAGKTIKVEQEKVDRLMRLVGELLVARGSFPVLGERLTQHGHNGFAREVKEAGASISRVAEELQATVLAIRMLPVRTVFDRFPRIVRDLARSLGKDIDFTIHGEHTELDKTVLEQIGDPLTHLIRNAVDHGIEKPDTRAGKGKPTKGKIELRAFAKGTSVIIEIIDDGGGLDPEVLKRKALEKGLISDLEAASMSTQAAYQLIFLPGFSTAEKVTDVSGRGVGMDVVRTNIRNVQGSIDIESTLTKGTHFSIHLPTSLMISKGILVSAGAEQYILPMENIVDMVKLPVDHIHEYGGQQLAQIRGAVYPLVKLREIFDISGDGKSPVECPIALIDSKGGRFGLVVDRFVREVEIVLKPLGSGLQKASQLLGAAILGDGRVVLVLNVNQLRQAPAVLSAVPPVRQLQS